MVKQLTCEMCGSTDLIKQDGVFICQSCGCKYSVEEARKIMVEGTVNVSGSTVKIDTSGELANLYKIARRAKNDNNGENAAKYYDMILIKDPNSWEAAFYLVYFRAMECRIAEIASAATSVANCIGSVLELIKDHVADRDEQKKAYTEVANRVSDIAGMLFNGAKGHYYDIDADIRDDYLQEWVDNAFASMNCVYVLGDSLDLQFGSDAEANALSVSAWKNGVTWHNSLIGHLADKTSNRNTINSYNSKIRKYETASTAPRGSSGGHVAAASNTEDRPNARGHEYSEQRYTQPTENTTPQQNMPTKPRKGMKTLSIICFVFAVIYALMSLMETFMLAMTVFFVIMGVMFKVLSKSPKGNAYILGKPSGIKKSVFVLVCVVLAFVLFGVTSGSMSNPVATPDGNTGAVSSNSPDKETPTTLADVEKWYKNQLPGVSQALIEYSKSVAGLSNINITESKFLFGEDSGWYDCHYTIYFSCKIDGALCTGEARGFLKYTEDDVAWFHFEIFKDSDWSTIVEHYDESYEKVLEDYYKELSKQYK